jgi:hypothetical protein
MTEFTFELPSPGSWDRSRTGLALVNEEAAHAAVCLLLGIPIQEVRVDRPICNGPDVDGWVKTVPDMSTEGLEMQVKALLAGPLAVGREISWPPSFIDGDDEGALARLCHVLGYDRARWDLAVFWVREVLQFPSTKRARLAIGSALLERGAIPGDELWQIVGDEAASDQHHGRKTPTKGYRVPQTKRR